MHSGTVQFASGRFLLLRPAEFPALRLQDQEEEQLQVLIASQMKVSVVFVPVIPEELNQYFLSETCEASSNMRL